jgi:hypothetical protein
MVQMVSHSGLGASGVYCCSEAVDHFPFREGINHVAAVIAQITLALHDYSTTDSSS